MKTLKKTLAVLLAAVMTFAMCGVAFAECAHESLAHVEANLNPICGQNGNIECWMCNSCYQYFADEEKTQPISYSEAYCIEPEYAEHDIQYELGFEQIEGKAWLSYDTYMDSYYQQNYGKTLPEYYADMGYTYWYCSHCGALQRMLYSGYEYYGRISDMFTVHNPGEVIEDPNEGFNRLPTADSDALEAGAYWYDLAGFIELMLQYVAPEDAEMMQTAYGSAEFYLSEDGSTLRMVMFGEPEDYDVNDPDNSMYTSFLKRHGVEPVDPNEGFILLPTADSDELEYGAYYFDLYAFAVASSGGPNATEEEIAENMEMLSVYDYYLSEDGNTLRMYSIFGSQDIERNSDAGSYYFTYVRQHGVEPADALEGFDPVAYSTDDIPYGGYLFLLEDYLDDYASSMAGEINYATNEPYTDEEIAAEIAQTREEILAAAIYINEAEGKLALVQPGIPAPMILDLDSEFAADIVEFITYWQPEWIPVHLTADGIAAGDYWFDVANLLGTDAGEEVEEFIATVSISLLEEPAAFRLTELDPDTGESFVAIIPADDEEFAADYEDFAANTYKTFSENKDATCLEDGYTGAIAIEKDGETVIIAAGETVEAPGHDFDDTIEDNVTVVEATCTEDGLKTVKCSRCDETDETVLVAPGHDFDDTIEANVTVVEATCTEDGLKTVKCSRCDAVDETVLTATGHTFGAWETVTAATCHSKGLAERRCACGETEQKELDIDPANHDGETELRGAAAATCTEAGYSGDVYCLGCGNVKTPGAAIAAAGHQWGEWTVTAEATDTEAGEEARECAVCHETETRAVPAKGDSLCKWCGEKHTGFWGGLVHLIHSVMYFFARLFGKR
ncbi:MAG: hypothetical protein IK108_08830 [Clostridia bacterium]|nr:hypothetical protein [Clostridia bacterium]